MAQTSQILSAKEPLTDPAGKVTRSWWRFFNSLDQTAGQLSEPVTIAPNSIIVAGTINAGSTVEIATLPAQTILGNAENVAAQPEPVAIGGGLSINAGTLAAASLAPLSLAGNPSNGADAPPSSIYLGDGLSMISGTLSATGGGGTGGLPLAETVAYWGM